MDKIYPQIKSDYLGTQHVYFIMFSRYLQFHRNVVALSQRGMYILMRTIFKKYMSELLLGMELDP
jgi:hypothetical protein